MPVVEECQSLPVHLLGTSQQRDPQEHPCCADQGHNLMVLSGFLNNVFGLLGIALEPNAGVWSNAAEVLTEDVQKYNIRRFLSSEADYFPPWRSSGAAKSYSSKHPCSSRANLAFVWNGRGHWSCPGRCHRNQVLSLQW